MERKGTGCTGDWRTVGTASVCTRVSGVFSVSCGATCVQPSLGATGSSLPLALAGNSRKTTVCRSRAPRPYSVYNCGSPGPLLPVSLSPRSMLVSATEHNWVLYSGSFGVVGWWNAGTLGVPGLRSSTGSAVRWCPHGSHLSVVLGAVGVVVALLSAPRPR